MQISLFIPCYVDRFFPQVGVSMVQIFERLGHSVHYPEGQTCCGQPPFNSGFQDQARETALHMLDCFRDTETVVVPSGSCGAMVRVFYPELFAGHPREEEAKSLAARTFEFSEFLVDVLKVEDVGASFPAKVTFHDGCHGLRELKIKKAPRTLLGHVKGLELIEMQEAESCCGFGGTFSVKMPHISTAMTEVKAHSLNETKAEYLVSNDPSCLLQIQGYLQRQKNPVPCLHLAEVLVKS